MSLNAIKTRLKNNIKNFVMRIVYEIRSLEMSYYSKTCHSLGVVSERIAESEVIVSLTSFGKRLHDVHLAIESIMQGLQKPNRIILWLAYDCQGVELPRCVQNQQKRGLEVKYCKDLRSYKKLIPTLHESSESIIITIDDDIIYHKNFLQTFLKYHKTYPDQVLANRVHRMNFDEQGHLRPYNSWYWESKKEDASRYNFFTGSGGVLYPPGCFTPEVFNEEVFLDICKFADDVWFYAMAVKAGRIIRNLPPHAHKFFMLVENPSVQDVSLNKTNLSQSGVNNDMQIKAVFERYNI